MKQINKKYMEDFEKLTQDWKRLTMRPSKESLNLLLQDIQQFERDLRNIKL